MQHLFALLLSFNVVNKLEGTGKRTTGTERIEKSGFLQRLSRSHGLLRDEERDKKKKL